MDKISLTMQDVANFPVLYETIKEQKLPIKVAYKFAQLSKELDNALTFYREKLQKILSEYALLDEQGQFVPTEDGSGVKLRPGTEEACSKAITELQGLNVEVNKVTFTIDELAGIELTTMEMGILLPFLAE